MPAGQKPLVIRYQSGTAVQHSSIAAADAPESSAAASQQRRAAQGDPYDPSAKPAAAGAAASRPAR